MSVASGDPPLERVRIRIEARRDLAATFRWYEQRSQGLGHEFLRAVAVALAAIDQAPERFPIALDDVRRAVLRRFPHLVYFVILPNGVVSVLAVMHGRRHPRRWQARR